MKNKKNNCLYFLKGISCIGVVIMHCGFPTTIGDLIRYVFKFAVPIFFMISGYFAYYEKEELIEKKLPKKMKHILKLTVIAEILYGVVYGVLMRNIELNINIQEIIIKIFIGNFFNGTLWFLYALFWTYGCFYIIHKCNLYKISYKIAPCILVFHVIARTYAKTFEWYDSRIFMNFILYGLPFFMIGNYIHKNKEALCQKYNNKQYFFGIIFGMGLTVIEYLVSRQALDFYIGTIIMSCSMFIYAIKNPEEKINSILYNIGAKISMYVYILHMLAIDISEIIGVNLKIGFYEWIKPINAIIISIILAYVCRIMFNLKSKDEIVNYGKN